MREKDEYYSEKSSLAWERERLRTIEKTFDMVSLRDFTPESISLIEHDLRRIIMDIHNAPTKEFDSKAAVQAHLYEAVIELILALEEASHKNIKTRAYFENLRKCQNSLEKALKCW